ncbi:MAG: response regulator, partial [Vicinamibacteria bacterium]|nr:response regulator [Vicinamibacteria bacterium]
RIEAGTVTLSPAAFEPRSMLEGLVQMLGVRARAKGLNLVLDAGADLPEAVVGDEGKVRQILLNLLSNGIKFTSQGAVTLKATWSRGEMRFTVIDQGPGLTPAEAATLFQPFVQTEAGRKSGEGTGLGLTISRSFARLMGGDITVASHPSSGTAFTVTLPLPEAGPGATARHREDRRRVKGFAPSDHQPLILIVDDVRENRLLLTRQMRSIGFQTSEAEDGAEAVERWRTDHPELILMDVRMKGMDGLQAARAIRAAETERGETRPVKIVALSASVLDDEIHGIRSSGCDDFLPKPFREGALFEKVAHLLDLKLLFEDRPVPFEDRPAMGVLTAERLATVSAGARERLREAVRLGDDQQARSAIEAIRIEDPELGEALEGTLSEFRFDTLLRIAEDASR